MVIEEDTSLKNLLQAPSSPWAFIDVFDETLGENVFWFRC